MLLLRYRNLNKQKTAESEARRYLKEGRVDKAIELAKKMVDKNPDDEKIRTLLGLAYIRNGRYDEGIAECREALRINPNYIEAYITLGKGALRKSEYKEAIDALTKALELEPENKDAHYQLGLTYDHLGMAGKAKEEYRKIYQKPASSAGPPMRRKETKEEIKPRGKRKKGGE